MARFADGLINRANRLFKNLIPTLGPDTGTVSHSAPGVRFDSYLLFALFVVPVS